MSRHILFILQNLKINPLLFYKQNEYHFPVHLQLSELYLHFYPLNFELFSMLAITNLIQLQLYHYRKYQTLYEHMFSFMHHCYKLILFLYEDMSYDFLSWYVYSASYLHLLNSNYHIQIGYNCSCFFQL